MEITYDYYRIFYYAAKYKSFSKAAEILMSNQPNITHFMNNLENQLGCRLFIRSNGEAIQACNNSISAFSTGRVRTGE